MFRSALFKSILSTARPAGFKAPCVPAAVRYYHENVISHYERPRNVRHAFFRTLLSDNLFQVGSLPKGDMDVGTGLVGAPA